MENTNPATETILLIGGLRERGKLYEETLAQFNQALASLSSALVGLEKRVADLETKVSGEAIPAKVIE